MKCKAPAVVFDFNGLDDDEPTYFKLFQRLLNEEGTTLREMTRWPMLSSKMKLNIYEEKNGRLS